jgi:Putative regulator of cell autolysis
MRMFKSRLRTGGVLINVLIAVAVSLIVNFSYFVFMILHRTARMPSEHPVSENSTLFMVLEVLFYMAVSFILLTVFTHNLSESKIRSRSFPKRLLAALVISVVVYFLAPYMNRAGDVKIILAARRLFNPMVLLKCSFMLAVVTLYGKIYELIVLQQRMTVENERLKTENLRSRYDVLINQMNPHFFFNSLNSLAMLVRENKNDDALVYIDRLSDTFRYIIQSGKSSMTTLRDEMAFLEAYKYLLELRYEGKLFIEAEIPEGYLGRTLPSLTLQPLVENAMKHNIITRTKPLTVTISVRGDWLLVSNPLQPKIDDSEKGT